MKKSLRRSRFHFLFQSRQRVEFRCRKQLLSLTEEAGRIIQVFHPLLLSSFLPQCAVSLSKAGPQTDFETINFLADRMYNCARPKNLFPERTSKAVLWWTYTLSVFQQLFTVRELRLSHVFIFGTSNRFKNLRTISSRSLIRYVIWRVWLNILAPKYENGWKIWTPQLVTPPST